MDDDVIDTDISRWILEFLLRQPVEDRILDSLLHVLPLPDNSPGLKKSLLLRELESEISNGVVPEKILQYLEHIEELDHQERSKESSDAIKAAYCAVAVECTVRYLKNGDKNVRGEYFDAVKRIWRGRVSRMEKSGSVGLVSEELLEWKDEIEAAIWEENACGEVVKRSEGINAVQAVRDYVKGEKERMGPPFLELVAETLKVKRDDAVWGVIGLGKREMGDQVRAKVATLPSDLQNSGNGNNDREVLKGNVLSRRKHVAHKRAREVTSGASRGAKIADFDESELGPSCNKNGVLGTPEVDKGQEALESRRLESQAAERGPLSDASRFADTVISSLANENRDHEPVSGNQNRGNTSVAVDSVVGQSGGENVCNESCSHQTHAPKQKHSAHSSKLDDSVDGSPEELPNSSRRPHLSTPRRQPVSPLKKYEVPKVTKRRKIKRWSNVEEDTLRTGVQKFGVGSWKLILNAYRDTFEERTEVDLKDKWRNMTRYG